MSALAFVTGAAGGIGEAAVRHFHAEGFQLWVTDRDEAGLERLRGSYPDAVIHTADLTDRSALEDLCTALEGADTPPTVAFVNAGVIEPGPSIDLPRASIDLQIDINLRAAAHLNHALAGAMAAAG
ncbi:MAG: SDR family NAD(P)-dependent oxidoreductase, partial [Pseudomonadota bacterium]